MKRKELVISKNESGIIGFSHKSRGRARQIGPQMLSQTELIRWTDRKVNLSEDV